MNPTPTVPASGTAPLAEAATPHLRPAAHFTARDTWLNDPNGLLHHAGVYHLFFQNNRQGQVWGPMSWGHATSTDLVTWSEQDVAIPNTPEENVFSGSAVADVRNTAGFAGPGQTALVAIYTSAFTPASSRPGIQAQSLAYSLDDGSSWTRYANNPVLDTGSSDFRDPKVFWHGGEDGRVAQGEPLAAVVMEAIRAGRVLPRYLCDDPQQPQNPEDDSDNQYGRRHPLWREQGLQITGDDVIPCGCGVQQRLRCPTGLQEQCDAGSQDNDAENCQPDPVQGSCGLSHRKPSF